MTRLTTFLSLLFFFIFLSACSPENSANSTDSDNKQTTGNQAKVTQEAKQESGYTFPYKFEKVTNNTWIMHGPRELPNPQNRGFMNNPGVIETSAGLVVVDPGSTVEVGKNVLVEINKISQKPIVAVFNTHIHGDHWLANQAIKAAYPDVKIYGHPEMLAEIEQGEGDNWVKTMETMTEGASKGTVVVGPNNAIDNTDVIQIGDTHFKIHHYGIAHTKTDIMIEVVENSVVFLGDNVLALRIPRTTDGTFAGNIATIKTILKSNAKIYVPGHGPTGDNNMVEQYLNYLTQIYEAAKKTFDEDLDSSDVITITKETTAMYKDWYGYADLVGPQGAQAYSEIEAAEF